MPDQPHTKPSLFQKLQKGTPAQPYLHIPLQQKALTAEDPEWELTEAQKQVRNCVTMFEYLHRRFGKDAGPLNAVLLSDDLLKWLSAPAANKSYPLPITNLFWLILHYVTPFDRLYDINTKSGIQSFYKDLVSKYFIGMNLPTRLIPDSVFDYLNEDFPCAIEPEQPVMPLSRGLAHFWHDYVQEIPFEPGDAMWRIKFFMRFLMLAKMAELDLRIFSPKLVQYLNGTLFPSTVDGAPVTGLIYKIMQLAGLGDVKQWQDKAYATEMIKRFFSGAFASLTLPPVIAEYHVALAAKMGIQLAMPECITNNTHANKKYVMQDVPALALDANKAWVNMIETGGKNTTFNAIGLQVLHAMKTANVPHTRIFPPHNPYDNLVKANNLENLPWGKVNLFAVEMDKCADVMLSQGLQFMNGRINIGYCTWETSQLPVAHQVALDLLDEIWVPTEYVKNIFAPHTKKPVHVMPYPVAQAQPSPYVSRKAYDITENAFVFMTAFDCYDLMARKNPLATVRAFQKAFPNDPNVRLVIKTRNMDKGDAPKEHTHLAHIQAATQKDPRIMLFHQNFTDAEMAAFINLADCYVSLHRNSAYGRTIIEAMMMGKPVIVTKGSGPADYANEKTAALVDATECSIIYDAYHYLDQERGHRWLDPDIAAAAKAMQRVAEDKAYATSIAKAGQTLIASQYNPEVTGAKMRARIEALMKGAAI